MDKSGTLIIIFILCELDFVGCFLIIIAHTKICEFLCDHMSACLYGETGWWSLEGKYWNLICFLLFSTELLHQFWSLEASGWHSSVRFFMQYISSPLLAVIICKRLLNMQLLITTPLAGTQAGLDKENKPSTSYQLWCALQYLWLLQ